jgi:GDPmannose 4,6-dehydratase
VTMLLSDTSKIRKLGFKIKHSLGDVIRDQINYFSKPENKV